MVLPPRPPRRAAGSSPANGSPATGRRCRSATRCRQHPFGWDASQLDYQVLGVVLQQLWIVGLWALLVAARVGRVTRALAMVAVLVSDLAIVNGFFVWPKLLPAAMLLAAAALVMTPLWTRAAPQPLGGGAGRGALRGWRCSATARASSGSSPSPWSPPTAGCRAGAGSGSRSAVGIVLMALLVRLPEVRRPARQPPHQVDPRRGPRHRRPRHRRGDRRRLPRSRASAAPSTTRPRTSRR